MKRYIISVIGEDRPGIIAAVTRTLFQHDCNIENVSQTILQSQFSGTFIVSTTAGISPGLLARRIAGGITPMGLEVLVKRIEEDRRPLSGENSDPFIITTIGPDRRGLVAGISGIIAGYGVNVTNLQAVFKGGDDPGGNIMIYEVDVPRDIDTHAFHEDLRRRAEELDLNITIQHRNIFEAINRI